MNPSSGGRMLRLLRQLLCLALLIGATALARAEIVQVIGASLRVNNPDGPQVVNVEATFLGDSSSLYTSELYLDAPTFLGPIFDNHATPVGQTRSLGNFLPETVLFIRNRSFFLDDPSDPSSPASYNFNFFTGNGTLPPNPDRLPHAVFSFDTDGPVTVSFEDVFGGGDLDFNDAIYSFTNVRAALVDVAVSPVVNVGESQAFAPFQSSYENQGTIENSGSIFNYGDGDNSGLLSNFGSLFNDLPGTLSNTTSGRIDNQGDFGSFGSLINSGSIENSGAFDNAGFLENFGSIVNGASGTVRNLFTGAIDNSGSVENSGTTQNLGNLLNQVTGTMANSIGGMIENLTTGSLVNRGTLLNRAGGTIENSGVIDNEGTLQNLGTLQNKLFGTLNNVIGALDNLSGSLLLNETGASVVNGGSFENAGTTQNLGNFLNQVTGTMNNSIGGMIENLTTGSLVNRGTLLNQSGGTIENSGVIDNEGTLRNLGTLLNKANGVINNTTGAIENLGTLLINAQSSVNGGGTYSQSGGSTVVDGTLGASRIDILGGVLSGSGVLQGDVLIGPDGTLAPGNSPGTLQIDGDFHLDGGRLAIELAALTMHDVLDISGAAFLDGGFIDYLFSFTPSAGDSFVFLTTLGGIAGLNTLNFNFFGDLGGLRFATLLIDDSLVLKVEGAEMSVPEPGVLWLIATALLIVAFDARRRGRRPIR